MPSASSPVAFLRGGEFYSPVRARLRTDGALLSELLQPVSRSVPRHEHELAYVTVILRGDYLEGDRGRLAELAPLTAVFNPAGVGHSTLIGPCGAQVFTIELCERSLQDLGIRLPQETTFDRGAGSMLWPGLRLYSAFKEQTAEPRALDSDILEAYVLEMLGAIAGFEVFTEKAPIWFDRVKEHLHEGFRGPLRMRDLAREAGIHPVHLARVFRRIEKRTPGEYQHSLKVRAACELLRDPEWPLAVIAADCGFADQSHFTRVFRRMTGATPARFREVVAGRTISTSHTF